MFKISIVGHSLQGMILLLGWRILPLCRRDMTPTAIETFKFVAPAASSSFISWSISQGKTFYKILKSRIGQIFTLNLTIRYIHTRCLY